MLKENFILNIIKS